MGFHGDTAWPVPGGRLHVVGLAGVGMNAVAQVLAGRGYSVTGSDRLADQGPSVPVLQVLAGQGIGLHPQDGSGIGPDTRGVVVSSAIEPDNPDLLAARARGCPVFHRAEALAAVIGTAPCIAVAGTSGKTTVTGLTGWLLTELGMAPHVVNGGAVLNWKSATTVGNVRLGSSPYWVIEADESDRSLLRFHPERAVILNITRDHFGLDETVALFAAFAAQVREEILCGPGVRELLQATGLPLPRLTPVVDDELPTLPDSLPGRHNRENARMAVALAEAYGYARDRAWAALARFRGIERRLELVGTADGVAVYDDYAHNPAKIAAAWSAVAERASGVRAIWRPHGFGPLAAMADELAAVFHAVCRPGDLLYLLPVYYAGGTATARVTSEQLAERLQAEGLPVRHRATLDDVEAELLAETGAGQAVLCMGARDPQWPVFARRLVARLRERTPSAGAGGDVT